MRRYRAAAAAAVLLLVAVAPAGAEVTVVGAGGAAGRSLAISTNDNKFTWSLFVVRNDKGDAQDVCLDVTPLIASQGGIVVAGGKLSVDSQEDPNKVCARLGAYERKEFRYVGNLPSEGEYKVQFGLIVKDDARVVYDGTITRKPVTARVGFGGASSDGKLATTSDRAAFAWTLMIRRTDSDASEKLPLRLWPSIFTGPGGKIIRPQLQRDGQPLKPAEPLELGSVPVVVTLVPGEGPSELADVEGAYTGEVTYEVLGARATVALTLTRTLPDLEFKAETITKLRGVVGDGPISFHLHLQNNSGAPRAIDEPGVFHLDRVVTTSSPPTEVAAGDYLVSVTSAKGGTLNFPLTVPANQPIDLVMSLDRLREAGAYKGVVRLSATDRKPLDLPFELSLRLCWWYAAGAIVLGVLLATAVRFVQQFLQPRLLVQQDEQQVRGKLQEFAQSQHDYLTPDERSVIDRLKTWLDQASATLRNPFGSTDAAMTQIGAVRKRQLLLAAWITARRRREAVRPLDIGDAVDNDLTTARAALTNADTSDNDLTTALTRMNAVEGTLRERLLGAIKAAADAMRGEIATLPTLDQLAAARVRADLDAVDAAVTATRVEEARPALDRARTSYIIAMSASLRQALGPAAPFGFNAANWNVFSADIRERLGEVLAEPDPADRIVRWNSLSEDYLGRVIGAALGAVEEELDRAPDPVKAAWSSAKTKLGEAATNVMGHHQAAAQRDYNAGLQLVRNALAAHAAVPGVAAPMAPAAVASAPAAGGAAPVGPTWADTAVAILVPLPLGPGATVAGVKRALVLSTLIILVLGLIVVTLSGLQVLYEPNPTFGRWDLAVAFLWGAGIQAAANQAFQGLQTLFR